MLKKCAFLFLLFSCAPAYVRITQPVHERQRARCVVYHRDNVTIPDSEMRACSRTEQSHGSITLHRGDTGSGLYDTPWWCTKWLVEAVMNSRGFCDVKLSDDKVLRASYCGATQPFFAPARLSWVVVKSEHNIVGSIN